MRRLLRPLPLLAFVLASGCIFQNVGSEEKLRDAVVGYNDETRWNAATKAHFAFRLASFGAKTRSSYTTAKTRACGSGKTAAYHAKSALP